MSKILKKNISLFLAFVIVLATILIQAPQGFAKEIATDNYTLLNIAYNPTKNVYVAVAKDFTTATNKAKLYTSTDDGETWKSTLSVEVAKHYAAPNIKQILSFWEEKGIFVVMLGENFYYSDDGVKWKKKADLKLGNSCLTTYGDRLVITGGSKINVVKSLDDYTITQLSKNSGLYLMFAGIDNISKRYIVGYNDMAYSVCENSDGTYSNTSSTRKVTNAPLSVNFIPEYSSWVCANNLKTILLYNSNNETTIGMYDVKFEDSTLNDELITSSYYHDNMVYLGTKNGNILYTDISENKISNDTIWKKVDNSRFKPNEIKNIALVKDNVFIVIDDKKPYIIYRKDDIVTMGDMNSKIEFSNENLRIEIPTIKSEDVYFNPTNKNYLGSMSSDLVVSFSPLNELPSGFTYEALDVIAGGDNVSKITVSPEAIGGTKIPMVVKTKKGETTNYEILFVSECDVELEGNPKVAIPSKEEKDAVYYYKAKILGQDKKEMKRNATITAKNLPENVFFNTNDNSLTVTDNSSGGTVLLEVQSEQSDLKKTFEIEIEPRKATGVLIEQQSETITVSDTDIIEKQYSAKVLDQTDKPMLEKSILWSMLSQKTGVEIEENGKLKILPTAFDGTVVLRATCKEEPSFYADLEINLELTDVRKCNEDLQTISKIDFSKLTTNVDFPKIGKYGSVITWKSNKSEVITDDGIVTRNPTFDTIATIVAKVELNGTVLTKEFPVTVLKETNITKNGDIEKGNLSEWNSVDAQPLVVTSTNKRSGEYGLSVSCGAYQEMNLQNDRTYSYSVYVKSNNPQDITFALEHGGVLETKNIDSNYTQLSGIYTYRNIDTLKDKIKITATAGNGFYLDDLCVFEITVEYNKVMEALQKAEYSRIDSDIDNAKKIINEFYDITLKAQLLKRANDIIPKNDTTDNENIGGGGSSGGGGGTSIKTPIVSETVKLPDYSEKIEYNNLKFKDLKDHWAKDDIEYMGKLNFVTGKEDGVFDPEGYITRGEFSTLIVRVMELPLKEYENSFFDIVTDDWYSKSVETAKDAGYINGSNGLFRPNDCLTREEMTKMIVTAYNKKKNLALSHGDAIYYNDIYNISQWAYDYIAQGTKLELVSGVDKNNFAPKSIATRAESVVMLKRLYDKLHNEGE